MLPIAEGGTYLDRNAPDATLIDAYIDRVGGLIREGRQHDEVTGFNGWVVDAMRKQSLGNQELKVVYLDGPVAATAQSGGASVAKEAVLDI